MTSDKLKKAHEVFQQGRKGKLWTPRNILVAALAAAYLISPIDAVPDWVFPVVGWLDDLGVLTWAALWILRHRRPPEPPQTSPRA